MELPRLENIWQKYKDQGFSLVAIETHVFPADLENAKKFIAENGFTFPMVRNGERFGENDVARVNSVNVETGLPTNVLIDKDGKMLFMHHKYKPGDEKEYAKEIEQLITYAKGSEE